MNNYPKVSIVTITYGHEKYIIDTLDGIFMQDYPGEIEVVISNDHSPDNTDKIIHDYLSNKNIPNNFNIQYTKHEINKGVGPNFSWTLQEATGKYIALCEGDDYWTDPLKLQKQVDFMEKNKEYILICANADNASKRFKDKDVSAFEILQANPIRTLTTLFRNTHLNSFKPKDRVIGDLQLWLYLAKYGKIFFLKDTVAYYRVLEDSASGRNDINKRINLFRDRIAITNEHIHSFNFSKKVKKKILQDQYSLLIMTCLKKRRSLAFSFYIESILKSKRINLLDLKILKNFL